MVYASEFRGYGFKVLGFRDRDLCVRDLQG